MLFEGSQLTINCSTAAEGSVRVEIQNAPGEPIPGFALADCSAISGDALDDTVTWNQRADVSQLAGQPIRLKFTMHDADLYAFQFRD